jgi:type IV pilus assembly protein PilB
VVTFEGRIDEPLEGVTRVPFDVQRDGAFARGLRAALQLDPDVLLVGQVDDAETARVVVQTALAGRLVLAALRTRGALDAVARFTDFGIERYQLADALRGFLTQRLVRRLCQHCARAASPDPQLQQWLGLAPDDRGYFEGVGCERCRHSGYSGRLALHEVLPVGGELSRRLRFGPTPEEWERAVREQQSATLRDDGIEKALLGLTTLTEIDSATARGGR